jgi:hypothetical protein
MGTTTRPFCSHPRMAASHLSWSHRSARSTPSSCPRTLLVPSRSCSGDRCTSAARACTAGTCASSPSANTLTQPLRRERARAKSSRRRKPRQKFSTRVYISGGLHVGSAGSPSQRTTSVSVKIKYMHDRFYGRGIGEGIAYRRCNGRTRSP